MPDHDDAVSPAPAAPTGEEPLFLTMDGILEGRARDAAALARAVRELDGLGICKFELERDGGRFTVMPDSGQVPGRGFDAARQQKLIEQLAAIAAATNGPVESTLRCTMVFENDCSETLFRSATPPPAGPGIEPVTRVRPRRPDDVPPSLPPAPRWQHLLRRREVSIVLPLLLLVFAFTAWRSGLVDRLLSANATGLTVDTGEFGDLLRAEVESSWGNYKVTVARGPGHPADAAAWDARIAAATATGEVQRVHAAVVRDGQDVYVQLQNAAGEVLAERMTSLRPLVTDTSAKLELPGHMTASRVVFSVAKHEKK